MTPEDHRLEHIRLHKAFDELLACYLAESKHPDGHPRTSIHDEIFALMRWSHSKTLAPSPTAGESL